MESYSNIRPEIMPLSNHRLSQDYLVVLGAWRLGNTCFLGHSQERGVQDVYER